MAARAPHLRDALRRFCLGAFALAGRELDDGAEIPFSFEEHRGDGRPALYEYRPLFRTFVDERLHRLAPSDDVRAALDELRREPAAAVFARAHGERGSAPDEALLRSVLVPLLTQTAEACGGFDWDDGAFERAYSNLEQTLFGSGRVYTALAPLVGISLGADVQLGDGVRVRLAASGELAAHWPQGNGLLPARFGREPDRLCLLELERSLGEGEEPPDASGEIGDAVTALRLATAGAVAAGPVLFERLDWRPLGVRSVLPISATPPRGEATRLDAVRGRRARDLRGRLVLGDADGDLGEALDRWELSLFQSEPFRSEGLREALAALLGATDGLFAAALRAAALLGANGSERAENFRVLRALVSGGEAGRSAEDAVRRTLVETLLQGDRAALVEALDDVLLGVRPRVSGAPAQALAG